MNTIPSQVFMRWCARRCIHLWSAPEIVVQWLDTWDEAIAPEAKHTLETIWGAWDETPPLTSFQNSRKMALDCANLLVDCDPSLEGWCAQTCSLSIAWSRGGGSANERAGAGVRYHQRAVRGYLQSIPSVLDLEALRDIMGSTAPILNLSWCLREVWRAQALEQRMPAPVMQIGIDYCDNHNAENQARGQGTDHSRDGSTASRLDRREGSTEGRDSGT